jgi:hypothetical protein
MLHDLSIWYPALFNSAPILFNIDAIIGLTMPLQTSAGRLTDHHQAVTFAGGESSIGILILALGYPWGFHGRDPEAYRSVLLAVWPFPVAAPVRNE